MLFLSRMRDGWRSTPKQKGWGCVECYRVEIRPTQLESWPMVAHLAAVVRARVWTDLFGNPTAEFRCLKESIRFWTSWLLSRINESPLLRVCANKDWLPSQDVYSSQSAAVPVAENLSSHTLFKVKSVYNLMKPWKYPKRIWAGIYLMSCGWL